MPLPQLGCLGWLPPPCPQTHTRETSLVGSLRLLWRKAKPRAVGWCKASPSLQTCGFSRALRGDGGRCVAGGGRSRARGPEGPQGAVCVASCGSCVCVCVCVCVCARARAPWRKQTWARVLVREGRQGSVGPGEVTQLEGVSRVWGLM